ncbi:hypothetical protein [Photobacterium leiognathi]|uniref:hypothetical protein n=1 Tax=Photobacterium leiognathi TaxID=553611 RepID=UPI002982079C|nr:hypothetical protein [Photobacterium leiognathi]
MALFAANAGFLSAVAWGKFARRIDDQRCDIPATVFTLAFAVSAQFEKSHATSLPKEIARLTKRKVALVLVTGALELLQ